MSPVNYWENKPCFFKQKLGVLFWRFDVGEFCKKLNWLNDLKRNFPKFVIDRLL
jgi:hypothetical protein